MKIRSIVMVAALISAAFTVTKDASAQVTVLAANQGANALGTIIVDADGSNVYWINFQSATVDSTNKTTPLSPITHFAVANRIGMWANADIVQDNLWIYFTVQLPDPICPPDDTYICKGFKASGSARQLFGGCGNVSSYGAIGIHFAAGGTLYFTGYPDASPPPAEQFVRSISTQGGNPTNRTPFDDGNFGHVLAFSTDSTELHFSSATSGGPGNIAPPGYIWRTPFINGILSNELTDSSNWVGALITPSNGAAGGYLFYVRVNPTTLVGTLMGKAPGGNPYALVNNIGSATPPNAIGPQFQRCFTVVGSNVYSEQAGKIVVVSINGGTPVTLVNAADAQGPVGLTSDSNYIYWTANNGSVRRVPVGGGPTPTPTPGPPIVTTNPATNVASFSATLNGTVNPNGFTTSVHFQYGTTTSYGSTTSSQSYSGNTTRAVSANISGLAANTIYHSRIVATNSHGTRYGGDRTFTTLSPTGPPVVVTNPATLIASFSAKLNGSANPHGLTTTVYFQYGTTTSYGLTTAIQTKSGNIYQNVAANVSGLAASTTYHFRIVATNSAGTRYGSDRTFTTLSATGPPVVVTNPATNVASSSATLNGSVDPHGLTTTVHFQYGTTVSYGHTTANQTKTGNTYQNVSANISGLSASTTYHFRIVATNSGGTRYGTDRTFTTP
jgi:hypothetical protein